MAPNWKGNILSRIGMGSSHGVGLYNGKTILRGGQITATYLMKAINESFIFFLFGKFLLNITQPSKYCMKIVHLNYLINNGEFLTVMTKYIL